MNKHTGEWPSSQPEIFPEYTLEHSKKWQAVYYTLKLNHDLGISTPPSFKQRDKDIYQEVLDKFNEDLKKNTIH